MGHAFGHPWTDAEKDRLVHLRDDLSFDWKSVADAMGLRVEQCRCMYAYLSDGRAYRSKRAAEGGRINCPNKNLIDRERRHRAQNFQSLTGSIFGDPPPGFSALDRRRASA